MLCLGASSLPTAMGDETMVGLPLYAPQRAAARRDHDIAGPAGRTAKPALWPRQRKRLARVHTGVSIFSSLWLSAGED